MCALATNACAITSRCSPNATCSLPHSRRSVHLSTTTFARRREGHEPLLWTATLNKWGLKDVHFSVIVTVLKKACWPFEENGWKRKMGSSRLQNKKLSKKTFWEDGKETQRAESKAMAMQKCYRKMVPNWLSHEEEKQCFCDGIKIVSIQIQ